MSPTPAQRDDALRRWRTEVQSALPQLPPERQDELALHAADRWLEAREAGLDAAAADARARRDLEGWPARGLPEAARPRRSLAGFPGDARSALRALATRPGTTLASVALVTIAMGASALLAALGYGILGRPLPYPSGDRLGVVWQRVRGEQGQVAYPDYADFKTASVFDGAAAISGGRGSVRVGEGVERVNVLQIEPAGFGLLGVTPMFGRLLTADDAAERVALVSHRFWRRHLSADPSAVGRTLWMSGTTYTVVGVLPAGVDFELPVGTFERESHDLWLPFDSTSSNITRRDVWTYEVLVRLAPGVLSSEAQAALDAIGLRLSGQHPETNAGRSFEFVGLRHHIVQRARPAIRLLIIAGAATFVIALANLITLTLVRLSARQRELAVREALGASWLRLRWQLLVESTALVAMGTAAGTGLAWLAARALAMNQAANLPRPESIRLDAIPLAIAAALGAAIVLVLTLLPARTDDRLSLLRAASRVVNSGSGLSRRLLIPLELAVALALSTGGVLLTLGLVRLLSLDPGFAVHDVAAARVSAYAERYPDRASTVSFFRELVGRARALPPVAAAAASSSLPLSGLGSGTAVAAFGRPVALNDQTTAGWQVVTPGYFGTVGISIVAGRDFTPDEVDRGAHVSIISASLAETLYPGEDPIGKRMSSGGGDDWHEVVGVAGDVRHLALAASPSPRVYDLIGQHWSRTLFLVARTDGSANALIPAMRGVVRDLDASAPLFEAATMTELVSRSTATFTLASRVASGLAVASLLIALLGVYGVILSNAASRTREFGVRIALGARPRDLRTRVLREHAQMLLAGGLLGLGASIVTVRLLEALLYGVDTADAAAVAAAIALALAVVAIGTALLATRKATAVDPLVALRD